MVRLSTTSMKSSPLGRPGQFDEPVAPATVWNSSSTPITSFGRNEKSFRMSKHDLQARPVYHHKRESIEAHLTIVFAALAVSHWIEHQTGWSLKKFVRTARRHRTVQIGAGRQTLTAADRLPDDTRDILA